MTIQTKIANKTNYKAANRTIKDIGYLVVHYTGNRGDTAKNNADYFARESGLNASAHYFVDEENIWQSVADKDVAWHCGAKKYIHSTCRNANSIGIEICMLDKAGHIRQKSIEQAGKLIVSLMAKYDIPISRVVRHYDVTGKGCPQPMVSSPKLWADFKAALTMPVHIEEEPEMTQQEFDKLMESWMQRNNPLYQSVAAMPGYLQAEAQQLVETGALQGNEKGLAVRYEQLRTLIIGKRYAEAISK